MPEYTDTSETDPGVVILELLCRGLDILSYRQDAQANECFLQTAERRRNALLLSNMLDYHPKNPTPAVHSEIIAFDGGAINEMLNTSPIESSMLYGDMQKAVFCTRPTTGEDRRYFTPLVNVFERYKIEISTGVYEWGDFKHLVAYEDKENVIHILTSGVSENPVTLPTDEDGNIDRSAINSYLFCIPVVHGIIIENEQIGTSDGTENQTFTLSKTPCAVDFSMNDIEGLIITVTDENGQVNRWTKVESFIDSKTTDKHYRAEVLDEDTVQICFGDSVAGLIPPKNSVIYATYLNGGGLSGNVGSRMITELQTTVSGVSYVYNLPFGDDLALDTDVQGTNKESLQSIKVNAPNHYRTSWGCLTTPDFADKLKELYPDLVIYSDSVKSPQDVNNTVEDVDGVNVYFIVRDNDTGKLLDGVKMYKDTNTLQRIESMFKERSVIGTNVYLRQTTFLDIDITATLFTFEGSKTSIDLEEKEKWDNTVNEIKEYLTYALNQKGCGYATPLSVIDLESDIVSKIDNVRSFRITSIGGVKSTGKPVSWDTTDVIIPCEQGEMFRFNSITAKERGEA